MKVINLMPIYQKVIIWYSRGNLGLLISVEFAKFSQRKYTEKPSCLVKQGGFFDF